MSELNLVIILGSIVMLHLLVGLGWVFWKIFLKKPKATGRKDLIDKSPENG